MELAEWLRSLGLEQYEATFRENAIDETVLRDLSEDHLRELGFPLGVRIKLLKAIASLGGGTTPVGPSASLALARSPVDVGERRQITVMFSDLVGSTALSARLDPEDLREVISAYQKCVAEPVHRFGGFVAKYLGDGVLIYFGYPQAHEDDAERAVRAGLELIAAVSSLPSPVLLQTRVGIATGVVVVGDLIGSGDAQQRGIVGETPNLAARLQGIAEPNTVVIAEGTRKLLGDLFELQDLGAKELKGIAGPVQAWAALRARSVEGRFEALRAAGLTALVGRDEECELLLRRWTRATRGEGRVVLLCGEAGIGKSRLTAALLEHLAGEPHARLRYFCSPQHTDSAFFPIVGQIERAAGLRHDDTAQAKLDKLDAVLAQTAMSKHDAALLADLLSLPNDGRYPALDLAPQQRRQKTLEALSLQLEALSRSRPVLMIFEDVHWIDPTSLEAVGMAVERIAGLRALLIVTHRPEFEPPWVGQPHVTALTINRLMQRDIVAMIDRVVGDKVLSASLRQDIIERTDGIPLFVEEMTKAVLEAQSESAARRTAAAVPSPAPAVPASLHASLMARLDRLGPAREVAQIGAVIGREFSHALLAAVVRKPEPEFDAALDRLVAAGLLFRQGVPPHASYWFKHALVQDAAYGTLLREPRRALHARIADVLERQFDDIAESQPELLARHCAEAGLIEKAATLWGKAGQRALARSALKEAAEQLARALGKIAALPGTAALRREQIRLQINLANALIHTKGHASPETRASFEQARVFIEHADALGEPADDPLALFSVMYGFWVGSRMAFNGDVALELATQFRELAQRQRATVPLMIGELLMGISLLLVGDLVEGRARLDRAIALYDPTVHRSLATRFGHDVRVSARAWRALASWMLGYPETAAQDAEHALGDAREIGHAATSMFALSHASLALILCGKHAAGGALADDLVALAESKGTSYWKSYGLLLRGWLLALSGRASDAISVTPAAITAMRSTGATAYAPWYLSYLGEAYAELERFDDAERCLAEAMTGIESTKERWCEADVHRVAGEIALMCPSPDAAQAEAHFARALSVARAQKAKSFELRAATALARLWHDQGKPDAARDLLAPVCAWFTEGVDTADLKDAKALLGRLAS